MLSSAQRFKARLRGGAPCLGSIASFADPVVSELLGGAGLDFVWVDMEHGPLDVEAVQAHLIALRAADCAGLVRVPSDDPAWIKRALDCGAAGVIVPLVMSAAQAAAAVRACRYPPRGTRGYGPRRAGNYGRAAGKAACDAADDAVSVIVQIEHAAALDDLDAILATPGLDAAIVGPADLAASLGLLTQTEHPTVIAAIERVLETARRHGVPAGIFAPTVAQARRWVAGGAQIVAVGSDYGLLCAAIDRVVAELRLAQRGDDHA